MTDAIGAYFSCRIEGFEGLIAIVCEPVISWLMEVEGLISMPELVGDHAEAPSSDSLESERWVSVVSSEISITSFFNLRRECLSALEPRPIMM